MNTEERQLAEMLHRVTPEPPRGVTVEDVASRVAGQAGYREPRPRRRSGRGFPGRGFSGWGFSGWSRGWAPVLAAASVLAVAGTTAGIATVVTSHHSPVHPAQGGGAPASSASVSSAPSSTPPSLPPASGTPLRIAGGMWGAELINRQSFTQDSLVSSGGSLYAASAGALDRIDPATGDILHSTPYSPPVPGRPVIVGNTVWVVWSYSGGNVVLHGYDAQTLAQVKSVPVAAIGVVSNAAKGVLAAGPDGRLYLAAGHTVAVVDPAAGRLIRQIDLFAGAASTVTVAPDGRTLYVGIASEASFRMLSFDLASGVEAGSSKMADGDAGNLLATGGGVWGTSGTGPSQWVWFALGGDLTSSFRVGQGASAGLDSVPSVSGGAMWIGGSHALACADPDTGRVRASTSIPTDRSVVEYFGSVTVLSSGRTYALYRDQAAQLSGVATLTPPSACAS